MYKLSFESYINKKIEKDTFQLFQENKFLKNIFYYNDSYEILNVYEYTENFSENFSFKRYIFYYDIVFEEEITKEYLQENIEIVKKIEDIYSFFDKYTSPELLKKFKILIN
jgi:hypothetical protein